MRDILHSNHHRLEVTKQDLRSYISVGPETEQGWELRSGWLKLHTLRQRPSSLLHRASLLQHRPPIISVSELLDRRLCLGEEEAHKSERLPR